MCLFLLDLVLSQPLSLAVYYNEALLFYNPQPLVNVNVNVLAPHLLILHESTEDDSTAFAKVYVSCPLGCESGNRVALAELNFTTSRYFLLEIV